MEKLKPCPFCGEYLVRTQNSYTNKHGEKCKEDYYSHDVLKNPEYCMAEEICVGNNLKDITAWNARHDNCQNCTEVKAEHEMYLRVCEVVSAQKRLIDKLKNCRKAKGDGN